VKISLSLSLSLYSIQLWIPLRYTFTFRMPHTHTHTYIYIGLGRLKETVKSEKGLIFLDFFGRRREKIVFLISLSLSLSLSSLLYSVYNYGFLYAIHFHFSLKGLIFGFCWKRQPFSSLSLSLCFLNFIIVQRFNFEEWKFCV